MKDKIIKLSKRKIDKNITNSATPDILIYKSIDSTNTHAKRMLQDGKLTDDTIILAEHQSAGRGRCGKDFYSPKSQGLYMSLCFLNDSNSAPIYLSSVCAVAVCEAIEEMTGLCAKIKWVNDIYVDEKKACGILCECIPVRDRFGIILGIGVNTATESFPTFENNIPTAIGNIDRNILCAKIYEKILLYKSESSDYKQKYTSRSYLDGKSITVHTNSGDYCARAIGIDDDCGLIILKDGSDTPTTLTSGEISIRLS